MNVRIKSKMDTNKNHKCFVQFFNLKVSTFFSPQQQGGYKQKTTQRT